MHVHCFYKPSSQILNKIPKQQLAIAAFNCKVYTRALMHLEYNAPNAGTSKKVWYDTLRNLAIGDYKSL